MGAFMYLQSSAKPYKAKETATNTSSKGEIRHVVCFKFKEDANPATIRKVEREFAALKGKISGIRSLEWGKNNSPEGLNKGFTHCFIVTFENEKARTAYLPHPDHPQAHSRGRLCDRLQSLIPFLFSFRFTLRNPPIQVTPKTYP